MANGETVAAYNPRGADTGGGSAERIYPYVGRWVALSVEFLENVFYGGEFR